MKSVVWITHDTTAQPEIEQACKFAEAHLEVVPHHEMLESRSVDLILWQDTALEEDMFLWLKQQYGEVVQMIHQGQRRNRLCPLTSAGSPRYYVVIPFDPEELGVIMKSLMK